MEVFCLQQMFQRMRVSAKRSFNPRFISCHYWVQKYSSFFSVQLQNLVGTFDALTFVIRCKHLWHPFCTTLSVPQITYDSVKGGLWYLHFFFKFSTCSWRSSILVLPFENSLHHLLTFLLDIESTIRVKKLSMDGCRRLATRVKKTDYRANLTLSMDR